MTVQAKRRPAAEPDEGARLDQVFAALADPVRRGILMRLNDGPLLVSELAYPFAISLQAVSWHIKVLVRAGLVVQERSGRIARCRLDAGPIYRAAVWLNRYSHYWQAQFDTMAAWMAEIADPRPSPRAPRSPGDKARRRRTKGRGKSS